MPRQISSAGRSMMAGLFFFLVTSRAISATNPPAGYLPIWQSTPPNITDLALIYCGGEKRLDWTPAQFEPYVRFHDAQSTRDSWLFDGFLFIEFRDGRGYEFAHGYKQKPARQQEWLALLERWFEPGRGIPALDAVCTETAQRLGSPTRRRQVVLTLPEPIFEQKDWGYLDGRTLDFAKAEDRIAACEWFVGRATERWRKQSPQYFDLAGFYWVAEHSKEGQAILPDVARIIHANQRRLFWIPYWKATGAGDWRSLGFDAAWQQPNHFFHPEVSDDRLDEACAFARQHGMGLELEFDGRVLTAPAQFRPRLPAYLQAFERNGVKTDASIAYYEGGGAMLSLANSTDPEQRGIYDKLARWILERQASADRLARTSDSNAPRNQREGK